jgi:hypothetical protein
VLACDASQIQDHLFVPDLARSRRPAAHSRHDIKEPFHPMLDLWTQAVVVPGAGSQQQVSHEQSVEAYDTCQQNGLCFTHVSKTLRLASFALPAPGNFYQTAFA